ncbi:MAG: hypothetical protein II349_00810, partial [Akkermansia sp.]|nr:hypothetical protein [Akkermansia sp.]
MIRPEKMVPRTPGIAKSVWQIIYAEAEKVAQAEPKLVGMLDDVVLSRNSLCSAVAVRLARKLSRRDIGRDDLEPLIRTILRNN